MFKRRSESTDILQEERAYNEAIHRLIAARTRGERNFQGVTEVYFCDAWITNYFVDELFC